MLKPNAETCVSVTKSHLLDVKLPEFGVEVSWWKTFWGILDDLVNSRKELSNVVKFTYLLTSLVDEPKELLKVLPVTNDNMKLL